MRMGKPPISWLAAIYVNVFRGMPALVRVIWVYFGLSLVLGVNFSAFQAGVIALSLLYSAFMAEVFRSALEAIPPGHREAGLACGMHPNPFFSIIMPQATKIAMPNIGRMFIGMIKDTSTFTVIGLIEVVRVTQNVNSQNFQPFVLYTGAAVLYVVVAFAIDFIFRAIEKLMESPPKGRVAQMVTRRKRRRIEAVVSRVGVTPEGGRGMFGERTTVVLRRSRPPPRSRSPAAAETTVTAEQHASSGGGEVGGGVQRFKPINSGQLTVGMNLQFKPEMYLDNGEPAGYDVDLLNELAPALNAKLNIQNLDFNGLIPGLQSKKFDMVSVGLTPTEERKQVVDFSRAYVPYGQCLARRHGRGQYHPVDPLNARARHHRPAGVLGRAAREEALPGGQGPGVPRPERRSPRVATGRAQGSVVEDYLLAQFQACNAGKLQKAGIEKPLDRVRHLGRTEGQRGVRQVPRQHGCARRRPTAPSSASTRRPSASTSSHRCRPADPGWRRMTC